MQALENTFEQFAQEVSARWWIGETPDVHDGQFAEAIAAKIGYPTASMNPFASDGLVQLSRQQAAHILAVAGTLSLAFDEPLPDQQQVKAAAKALQELSSDAKFFSNGLWNTRDGHWWIPLSDATFDCGVIGYDNNNGFVFWVEEED